MTDRLKATELLGRSCADFIEVRLAPIVTDPHASVESLVERFNTIPDHQDAAGKPSEAPEPQCAHARQYSTLTCSTAQRLEEQKALNEIVTGIDRLDQRRGAELLLARFKEAD